MRTLFFLLLILVLLNHSTVTPVFAQQPSQNPAPSSKPVTDDKPPAPSASTATSSPFEAAMALYRAAKFEEASAAFAQLSQNGSPDAAKACAWLARVDLHLEKIDDAEKAARKALELSPNLPTGHSALGEVYFRQGKFPEAEKEFLIPMQAGIADAHAFLSEGKISWYTSNRKHASQLIDKAHLVDSQDPEILRWWLTTRPRLEKVLADPKPANGGSSSASDPPAPSALVSSSANSPLQSPCTLATPMSSTEAPLERLTVDAVHIRGFGLVVKLNGTPSRLQLDTGASGILVNTKIAEKAGLRRGSDTQTKGIGDQGAASGYIGYADSIQVGGLEFKNCRVRVVDRKRSIGEDGFIGSDVFQDFLIDLNFPDEKFALSPLPDPPNATQQHAGVGLQSDESMQAQLHDRYIAPDMQSYERFYRIGHDILLPTLVNTAGNARIFLVDTGAYENTLSVDYARQVTKVYNDEYTIVRGLSGRVKNVYRADQITLAFPYSRLMQKANDVTAMDLSDMSDSAGTEVSGIVGFSLLWMLDIKIDYRDGLIHFSYDPHRLH